MKLHRGRRVPADIWNSGWADTGMSDLANTERDPCAVGLTDPLATVVAVCGWWVARIFHTRAVARSLHRPRTAVGKSATIGGLYVIAALVAAMLPFVRLLSSWSMPLSCVALVIAFVVGQQLVSYNGWIQIGGFFVAGVLVVPAGLAAPSTALALHGDRVAAVVTGVVAHGSHNSRTYHYALAAADGHRIPGHLVEIGDDYAVGDVVTIVVDRHGWVDPKTTGEVDAVGALWLTAAIGLLFIVVLSALGGRSGKSGRPPRRGPFGIWIFDRD
jgi:hypothetical protein